VFVDEVTRAREVGTEGTPEGPKPHHPRMAHHFGQRSALRRVFDQTTGVCIL